MWNNLPRFEEILDEEEGDDILGELQKFPSYKGKEKMRKSPERRLLVIEEELKPPSESSQISSQDIAVSSSQGVEGDDKVIFPEVFALPEGVALTEHISRVRAIRAEKTSLVLRMWVIQGKEGKSPHGCPH